jgi:hypothetical protein
MAAQGDRCVVACPVAVPLDVAFDAVVIEPAGVRRR